MDKRRGIGPNRVVRKSIQITNDVDNKLNRLSVSTGLPPATIISAFLEMALNNESHINWIQDKYNKRPGFRAIPVVEGQQLFLV